MATLLCISTVGSCISSGIIVYTEYQSFCPFLGIGSPHPLTRKRVCLHAPLDPKGGGATLPCGRGAQFRRLERKPGTLYTLYWTRSSRCAVKTSSQLAEGNSAFQRRSLLSRLENRLNGQKHVIFGLWLPSINVLPVNTVQLLLFFCTVRRTVLDICQKMQKNMEKIFNKINFHYFFWTPLGRKVSI